MGTNPLTVDVAGGGAATCIDTGWSSSSTYLRKRKSVPLVCGPVWEPLSGAETRTWSRTGTGDREGVTGGIAFLETQRWRLRVIADIVSKSASLTEESCRRVRPHRTVGGATRSIRTNRERPSSYGAHGFCLSNSKWSGVRKLPRSPGLWGPGTEGCSSWLEDEFEIRKACRVERKLRLISTGKLRAGATGSKRSCASMVHLVADCVRGLADAPRVLPRYCAVRFNPRSGRQHGSRFCWGENDVVCRPVERRGSTCSTAPKANGQISKRVQVP